MEKKIVCQKCGKPNEKQQYQCKECKRKFIIELNYSKWFKRQAIQIFYEGNSGIAEGRIMCIIHFECPPFDVFFSSFQTAVIFYIKRSFYAVLTSLKLSLNHATIAWFSTHKNARIYKILAFGEIII